ncbi:MAG: nitroreductase [Erysipelotrichaceae bacterium]|nr:nitroreductase [Erysipelotrichaceae bacterium]
MNEALYPLIFKRKSFHLFRDNRTRISYSETHHINEDEYRMIEEFFVKTERLDPDIRIAMRIADNEETSCARGQEKVILLYSEEKGNWLMNIGYVGEQLDLYLASLNIGTLWFGLNKKDMPDLDDLKYVIMIAVCKVPEDSFRKDMFKATRKSLDEIWQGETIEGVSDIVRFAPSACNTQPWITRYEDPILHVYRYRSPVKKGVMPEAGLIHYNHIDIGIFLCFLELCLKHEKIAFKRKLYIDDHNDELNPVADYEVTFPKK